MRFSCKILLSAILSLTVQAGAAESTDGETAFEQGQYGKAFALFSQGHASGDARSGYFKARMLELGLAGGDQDPKSAGEIYRQAAKAGYAPAFNRVGLMYTRGDLGAARDEKRAAEYFKRGGAAGDPNALFNLSRLYLTGRGVAKDEGRGIELLKRAAAQDHILALNSLGALYLKMPDPDRKRQARDYFARSSTLGNAAGLFQMGLFHLHDGNKPENLRTAHKYFNLASARGHPQAKDALRSVTAQLSAQDIEQAQRDARAFKADMPRERQ